MPYRVTATGKSGKRYTLTFEREPTPADIDAALAALEKPSAPARPRSATPTKTAPTEAPATDVSDEYSIRTIAALRAASDPSRGLSMTAAEVGGMPRYPGARPTTIAENLAVKQEIERERRAAEARRKAEAKKKPTPKGSWEGTPTAAAPGARGLTARDVVDIGKAFWSGAVTGTGSVIESVGRFFEEVNRRTGPPAAYRGGIEASKVPAGPLAQFIAGLKGYGQQVVRPERRYEEEALEASQRLLGPTAGGIVYSMTNPLDAYLLGTGIAGVPRLLTSAAKGSRAVGKAVLGPPPVRIPQAAGQRVVSGRKAPAIFEEIGPPPIPEPAVKAGHLKRAISHGDDIAAPGEVLVPGQPAANPVMAAKMKKAGVPAGERIPKGRQSGAVLGTYLKFLTRTGGTLAGVHMMGQALQDDDMTWTDTRLWGGVASILGSWVLTDPALLPRLWRGTQYTLNVMDPVEFVVAGNRNRLVEVSVGKSRLPALLPNARWVDKGKGIMSAGYGDLKDAGVNALSRAVTWGRQYRAALEPYYFDAIAPLRMGGAKFAPLDPSRLVYANKWFARIYEKHGLKGFEQAYAMIDERKVRIPGWMRDLAGKWEEFLQQQRVLNKELGVMVKFGKKTVTFEEAVEIVTEGGKKGYFPLGLNQRYMDALRAGGGKDYMDLKKAVPGLVRQFESILTPAGKARFLNSLDTPLYGHFELGRRYPLHYHMRETSPIAWLNRFMGSGTQRQGLIKVFGQGDLMDEYFAPIVDTMRRQGEGWQARALQSMVWDTQGLLKSGDSLLGHPFLSAVHDKLLMPLDDLMRTALFSSMAIANIAGFALPAGGYGVINLLKAMKRVTSKMHRAELAKFGAIHANAMASFTESAKGPLRAIQHTGMKMTGGYGINQIINHVSASAAEMVFEQYVRALAAEKKFSFGGIFLNGAIAKRRLMRDFHLPENMVDRLEVMARSGKFKLREHEELYRRAVQRATPAMNAMFESPMDAPPWFRHNSTIRLVLMATSYMRAASKSFRSAMIEATRGNFRPAANIILGTGAAVTAQKWLRDQVANTAQTLKMSEADVLQITLDYLLEAGWFGFMGWAAKTGGFASSPDEALMASFTPPTLRVAARVLNDLYAGNVGAPEDTGIVYGGQRALETAAPLYRYVSNTMDADLLKDARWTRSAFMTFRKRKGIPVHTIGSWPDADSHAGRYLLEYLYSKDEEKNWPEGLHPLLRKYIYLKKREGMQQGKSAEEIIAGMKASMAALRPVPKTLEHQFLAWLPYERRATAVRVLRHHDLATEAIFPQ